jgi:hypothetical protein
MHGTTVKKQGHQHLPKETTLVVVCNPNMNYEKKLKNHNQQLYILFVLEIFLLDLRYFEILRNAER